MMGPGNLSASLVRHVTRLQNSLDVWAFLYPTELEHNFGVPVVFKLPQ